MREVRETRETTEKVERRRRGGDDEMTARRMPVRKSLLDLDRFTYRWVNDEPGRPQYMYDDNWDFVDRNGEAMAPESTDLGSRISQIVGVAQDGSALVAYLMRKPKSFYDEDQKKKNADLDEQLAQLRRGNDRSGGAQADYIPSEGIRL
jgi:hypothetical protein